MTADAAYTYAAIAVCALADALVRYAVWHVWAVDGGNGE